MRKFLTKDIKASIEDVDMKQGVVILYASAFNNVDSVKDVVLPGAFKKTIQERKGRIKHLWQHDSYTPIGKPEQMFEDAKGLRIESYITEANNGYYRKLYQEGIITEHSIGYETINEKADKDAGVNYLTELKLWEYSAVTWGANPETPTVGFKGVENIDIPTLSQRMERLTQFIKRSDATDETLQALELEVKQLATMIDSLTNDEPRKHSDEVEPNEEINLVELYKSL